jgi:hypothetical protein
LPVADPDSRGVAEARHRQRRPRLHAQERQVEDGVETDDARGDPAARVQAHAQRGGAVHDVRVGQNLTILVDDHARADDGLEPPVRLGLVDLHRLDGDDGRGDPLEDGGEWLRAGLGRRGDRPGQQDGKQQQPEAHEKPMIH